MQMANSGVPHDIPEEMLMQHFVGGLNSDSAFLMNVASEGSVLYKTVAKVQMILDKVRDTSQFTGVYDEQS